MLTFLFSIDYPKPRNRLQVNLKFAQRVLAVYLSEYSLCGQLVLPFRNALVDLVLYHYLARDLLAFQLEPWGLQGYSGLSNYSVRKVSQNYFHGNFLT